MRNNIEQLSVPKIRTMTAGVSLALLAMPTAASAESIIDESQIETQVVTQFDEPTTAEQELSVTTNADDVLVEADAAPTIEAEAEAVDAPDDQAEVSQTIDSENDVMVSDADQKAQEPAVIDAVQEVDQEAEVEQADTIDEPTEIVATDAVAEAVETVEEQPTDDVVETAIETDTAAVEAEAIDETMYVNHNDFSWTSSLGVEGELELSGSLSVHASRNPGDTIQLGQYTVPAGHENEVCAVTYSTGNNHSVRPGTQILISDSNETVVLDNIEDSVGAVHRTSGVFSPDADGEVVTLTGVFGTSVDDDGNTYGAISANGSFEVDCEKIQQPEEVEEPVAETPVQPTPVEEPPVTTEEPVAEETPVIIPTPVPVEDTILGPPIMIEPPVFELPVLEQPVQPVVQPEPETLPVTGNETSGMVAGGLGLLMLGATAVLSEQRSKRARAALATVQAK